ncbi:hypothetical protein Q75_02095 [Bacillus coahuilensis p1.1.43]|uniref:NERD domain-containing protein n=1 Tax=Bacillus coahuilensis p1.1.43 TaxID=1150625 RepID=A0A147KBY6_9BACI|nr:hypothetical protein Q75_02095 [Bacillus coahuilensis p1.1.43]
MKRLFKSNKELTKNSSSNNRANQPSKAKTKATSERIGQLGEYKIDIQLSQFPNNYRYLSDIMLPNSKAKSGYSQIDHLLITPFGIFVMETKNYSGEIRGGRQDKQWIVNKRFKMMNPFNQNYGHMQALKSVLGNHDLHFISIITFTKRAVFSIDPELRKIQSDDLCVYDTELTEFINRKIQVIKLLNETKKLTNEEIDGYYKRIVEVNIDDTATRKEHVEKIKSHDSIPAVCSHCGTKVSEKVKEYCLSHNRYNGQVYCFDHQKLNKK